MVENKFREKFFDAVNQLNTIDYWFRFLGYATLTGALFYADMKYGGSFWPLKILAYGSLIGIIFVAVSLFQISFAILNIKDTKWKTYLAFMLSILLTTFISLSLSAWVVITFIAAK